MSLVSLISHLNSEEQLVKIVVCRMNTQLNGGGTKLLWLYMDLLNVTGTHMFSYVAHSTEAQSLQVELLCKGD